MSNTGINHHLINMLRFWLLLHCHNYCRSVYPINIIYTHYRHHWKLTLTASVASFLIHHQVDSFLIHHQHPTSYR